jgi:hypothetical protein
MGEKLQEKMGVDSPKKSESNVNSNVVPDTQNMQTNMSKKAKLREKKRLRALAKEKPEHKIPRGVAQSGRIWKTPKEK